MAKEEELRHEYEELQKKLQDPAVFSTKEYPKLAKRQRELMGILDLFDKRNKLDKIHQDTSDLTKDKNLEIAQLADQELKSIAICPDIVNTAFCSNLLRVYFISLPHK